MNASNEKNQGPVKAEAPVAEMAAAVPEALPQPSQAIAQAEQQPDTTEVILGQAPSEEQEFYVEWGYETIKNNLKFLNEVLRQLVTLSAALLGGSIAFYDPNMIGKGFKNAVVALYLFALIASFLGVLPYEGEINPQNPNSVKRHKEAARRYKRALLFVAEILLILGFLVALTGMLLR